MKINLHTRRAARGTSCFLLLFAALSVSAQPATRSGVAADPSTTNTALLSAKEIHESWHRVSLVQEKAAAERGDPTAQCHLAWRFEMGEGVAKDPKSAAQWMRKSAEQGLAAAQNALGWMYDHGFGVPEDRDAAMDWTRKATDQGYTPAEVNMGWMLANEKAKPGESRKGNYPVAAEWYERAAKKGDAIAQFRLGELFHRGRLGNDQRSNCIPWLLKAAQNSHTEAQALVGQLPRYYPDSPLLKGAVIADSLRRAAEKGNVQAQFELARRLQAGDAVAKNPVEAFRWMKQAAESDAQSTRVTDAWYELARMYENGEGTPKNLSAAWPLYLSAAEVNNDAVFRVGRMYEEGTGVPQDYNQAAEYYVRAINQNWDNFVSQAAMHLVRLYAAGRGLSKNKNEAEEQINVLARSSDPQIQFQIAEIYFQGRVFSKDTEAAVQHYTQAAKFGSLEAVNRIGEMWAAGLNGKPDFAEAVACYRKAGQRGLAEAQFNLGLCYAKGEGVPVEKIEAWRWLNAAAVQNFAPARAEIKKLETGMSRDDLAEATKQGSPVKPTTKNESR